MRSLKTLLHASIDYAGLFPPARLDMNGAVKNYSSYINGEHAWMLGRFIVPVDRLEEFENCAGSLLPRNESRPWRLSALAGKDMLAELQAIRCFNERHRVGSIEGNAIIETIEFRAVSVSGIESDVEATGTGFQLYVEIPVEGDPTSLIGAIKRGGAKAKVRTGGITPEAFPSSADLARFIVACVRNGVEFKATAGLHHPLRAWYRLTYEQSGPAGVMYGFLNVFLAAALAKKGVGPEVVKELLEELDHRAFSFDDDSISWKQHRLDVDDLGDARTTCAKSFGSCSFTEPIEELQSMGLL